MTPRERKLEAVADRVPTDILDAIAASAWRYQYLVIHPDGQHSFHFRLPSAVKAAKKAGAPEFISLQK